MTSNNEICFANGKHNFTNRYTFKSYYVYYFIYFGICFCCLSIGCIGYFWFFVKARFAVHKRTRNRAYTYRPYSKSSTQWSIPRTCLRYSVNSCFFRSTSNYNYVFVCLIEVSNKSFNNTTQYYNYESDYFGKCCFHFYNGTL